MDIDPFCWLCIIVLIALTPYDNDNNNDDDDDDDDGGGGGGDSSSFNLDMIHI